jgi:hypothetical protein
MTDDWEARMSERAKVRQPPEPEWPQSDRPDPSTWPVPDHIKSYSGRDVLLWYISRGWEQIFGGEVVVLFDHDFGHHVLRNGPWQLTLTNVDQFPDHEFGKES